MMRHLHLFISICYIFFSTNLDGQTCAGATTSFTWQGEGSGNQAVWNIDQTSATYTNVNGSGVNVGLSLSDPHNQNTNTGNPADDNSHTQSNHSWSPATLLFQLTSSTTETYTTFTFTFSQPILLSNLEVGDIDAYAPNGDNPNSYQDKVSFSGSLSNGNVPLTLTPKPISRGFHRFTISGQTATGIWGNNDTQPNRPHGRVIVSSSDAIDQLTISYANGSADDGNSNSHAAVVDGFDFCIADLLLPVELASIDGSLEDDAIMLHWSTASELNSDYFEVQRSIDGKHFERIGQVVAQGFSNGLFDYEFMDGYPGFGPNYYRLKQVDLDGDYEFSEIVVVEYISAEFQVFPNPADHYILIQTEEMDERVFEVFDMSGRKIKSVSTPYGQYRIVIDLNDLQAGAYYVKESSSKSAKSQMFFKALKR